jgi:hypothetical protein
VFLQRWNERGRHYETRRLVGSAVGKKGKAGRGGSAQEPYRDPVQ